MTLSGLSGSSRESMLFREGTSAQWLRIGLFHGSESQGQHTKCLLPGTLLSEHFMPSPNSDVVLLGNQLAIFSVDGGLLHLTATMYSVSEPTPIKTKPRPLVLLRVPSNITTNDIAVDLWRGIIYITPDDLAPLVGDASYHSVIAHSFFDL